MNHPDGDHRDDGDHNGRIAVLGAGTWGAALAVMWKRAGRDVGIWAYLDLEVERLRGLRDRGKFLAGAEIPAELHVSKSMEEILAGAELVVVAVPSQAMRSVVEKAAPYIPENAVVVSAAKGLEESVDGGLKRMTQVIGEVLSGIGRTNDVVALSGPSHAEEVALMMPTTIVAAGPAAAALLVQRACSTPILRVYTADDVAGVEFGGALKNPIAIAAGIGAGLGAGDNAMGALVTRGVLEIARLGKILGADQKTFFGLSGIGDLVTTCISRHSRNRRVGFELARGRSLDEIVSELGMVAEGVETARVVDRWAKKFGVETPIISAVVRVFDGANPEDELTQLMMRTLKEENLGA